MNLCYLIMIAGTNFCFSRKLKPIILGLLIVFFSMAIAISPVWAQESLVLSASKDNTLIETANGDLSNGMGSSFFVGKTNQNSESIRRGLIAFDIADQIPAGSTITEVQLTLNLERTPGGDEFIELYRVLSDWGEGNSSTKGGRGAPAAKGDATWLYAFYDTDLWSESGGDFATDISAEKMVGDVGTYVWGSTPEMVRDVQEWLDSPSTNFGWLLFGNETDSGTVKVFASRQNDDSTLQPQLSVAFQS